MSEDIFRSLTDKLSHEKRSQRRAIELDKTLKGKAVRALNKRRKLPPGRKLQKGSLSDLSTDLDAKIRAL